VSLRVSDIVKAGPVCVCVCMNVHESFKNLDYDSSQVHAYEKLNPFVNYLTNKAEDTCAVVNYYMKTYYSLSFSRCRLLASQFTRRLFGEILVEKFSMPARYLLVPVDLDTSEQNENENGEDRAIEAEVTLI